MNDLYPGEKRDILEGFHLYRGRGEIFDLYLDTPANNKRKYTINFDNNYLLRGVLFALDKEGFLPVHEDFR